MDSLVKSVWLQVARNPMDGLSGEVGEAADGQEPHGCLPVLVSVAAAIHSMAASPLQSVWLHMARKSMAASPLLLVWLQMARNPMATSLLHSVRLQMARNPMATSPLQTCLLYTSPSPRDS